MLWSFSTLKILATVKPQRVIESAPTGFSTLKILATVKPYNDCTIENYSFSTLKILAYKYEMISND